MTPDDILNRFVGDLVGVSSDPDHIPTDLTGLAIEQGKQAIVANAEKKDAEAQELRQAERVSQAIVGRIASQAPTGAPQPLTAQPTAQEVDEAALFEASLQEKTHEPTEEDKLFEASLDETPPTRPETVGQFKLRELVGALGDGALEMTIDEASAKFQEQATEAEELKDVPEESHGVDQMTFNSFATVEGNRPKAYKDSQGLTTVGVGFNMEQTGAKDIWKQAGVDQDFDSVKTGREDLSPGNVRKLLGVTIASSAKKAQARAEELGRDWASMPQWHKDIVTDIAFNTGSVKNWKKVFTSKNKLAVLREARRREGGKNTTGMDNRVARIGISLGIIKSVEEARRIGLKLTKLSASEVAKLRKEFKVASAGEGDELNG